MATFTLTPNMNLPLPTIGVDPGPDYATNQNNATLILDAHNHSPGSGVQVTPAGLNISSDLSFGSNNATNLRSTRFTSQPSALSGLLDIGCLYESGVDLYFNDGNGNQIRITQSGSVTGSAGTITGLPSGTASASYSAGTFVFQSATLTSANVDGQSFILRNNSASSKGLTLSPPAAMASDFSVVLPALPAATGFVQIDTSGNMGASIAISGGITSSNIAAGTITGSNIAASTITGTNITSSINLPGKAVQETSKNIVVSNTNATNSLAIVRGTFHYTGSAMAIDAGEGFSVVRSSTGIYIVSFSSVFNDTPVTTASIQNTQGTIEVQSVSTSQVTLIVFNPSFAVTDSALVNFITIGQRT